MSEQNASATSAPAGLPQDLELAGRRIDAELRRKHNKVMSLTSDAGSALEALTSDYLADLGQEAVRLARRGRLRTVDREHVEQAAERLGMGSAHSRIGNASNTLGGLLAGAGLAAGYAVTFTGGQHSTAEVVTAILLCIFGFSFLAVGLTLTMVRER
jgi:histone H3/H4